MDIPNEFFNEINSWDLNHFPHTSQNLKNGKKMSVAKNT